MPQPSCWSNSMMWIVDTIEGHRILTETQTNNISLIEGFQIKCVKVNQMIEPGDLMSFVRFLDCHRTQHLVNFFHGWTRTQQSSQDTEQARQYSMEIWTGTFSQIIDKRFLSGQTLTSPTQFNGVFRRHLIYSLPKPKLIYNYNFNN